MSIIAWIVIGLIAGALAKMAVPGEGPGGWLGDIIVGIVGALIGGFVFHQFGKSGVDGFDLYSILVAFVGSVLLLWLMRAFTGRRPLAR